MSRHVFTTKRRHRRGTRSISARPMIVVLSALSMLAGILVVPTAAIAATTITFPTPDHYFDPMYQDVTGTHVTTTEPTLLPYSISPEEHYEVL